MAESGMERLWAFVRSSSHMQYLTKEIFHVHGLAMDQMLYPDHSDLLVLFMSLLTSGIYSLHCCHIKLVMLAEYGPLIEIGSGKPYIWEKENPRSLDGKSCLTSDECSRKHLQKQQNWSIIVLYQYAKLCRQIFCFSFSSLSLCVNFANLVVFRTKLSPYTIALAVPHRTFIMRRGNYLLFSYY